MDPAQLEIILRRKLFTSESLQGYKEQGIITEDQEQSVQAVIGKSRGHLTTADLETIMFGGVLGIGQVKKILIKGRQTEEDLELKFNDIWIGLIAQLPHVSGDSVNIEGEVETTLMKFARERGYETQLIGIMQEGKKTLRGWGKRDELTLVEDKHYTKPTSKKFKHLFYGSGETLAAAQKMTGNVLDEAKKCLQKISEQRTDFKPGFTRELLRQVDTAITKESITIKDQLSITHEYQIHSTLSGMWEGNSRV